MTERKTHVLTTDIISQPNVPMRSVHFVASRIIFHTNENNTMYHQLQHTAPRCLTQTPRLFYLFIFFFLLFFACNTFLILTSSISSHPIHTNVIIRTYSLYSVLNSIRPINDIHTVVVQCNQQNKIN